MCSLVLSKGGGPDALVATPIVTALFFAFCVCVCSAVQVPKFRRLVLDDNFPGGYQVAVADVDGDGKPDVLALGEGRACEIAWYKNPSWKRYPISVDATKDNVDFAVHDIDGDGELEIAVASDFQLHKSTSGGAISWLKRRKSLDEPWAVHRIDAEPTTHRLRWADVDGDGEKELIAAPILGRGAKRPRYDQAPAKLVLYRIPKANPLEPWPKELIDETLHVTHGLTVCDFDGDGRDELLTASFEGVHLFDFEGKGKNARWRKTRLCAGNQQRDVPRGSSEVCVGKLRGGTRFIATIDPWHGNEVVVYVPPRPPTTAPPLRIADCRLRNPESEIRNPKSEQALSESSAEKSPGLWQRHVLDDSLSQGHALCCADFNGDGSDEIIAGFRGRGGGIYIYSPSDESGTRWQKSVLDEGGIAAQGFFVLDVTPSDLSGAGDGLPDFVATGGSSHNVHLYLNIHQGEKTKRPGGHRD